MNRYDRYPGDYLRQTLALTPAQDGMYGRLMDYYYTTERPIPADEADSVTRCRNEEDREITQWVLRRFFELTPEGWRHDRIEREIEKARPRIDAARINGLKGGRPKKEPIGKPNGLASGEPSKNPGRKLPSPSPSPYTKQEHSEPNGSGAAAPKSADPIWHTGLSFLERKGIPKDQARKFLGKLKREAGDIQAAALLAEAESQDITDPIPWLSKGAISAKKGKPSVAASFSTTKYEGTPDDQLPSFMR